jgi:two-component system, OmpR family, response regulator
MKVLIVDDDAHIREVIAFTLEQAGLRVLEAADGRQALELFEREQPDLVVLDIVMPELDGTEVCRALRRRSSVPIVFLSSRDDELDRILGLELGGDDYVTKPFSPRELLARIRAVARRARADPAEDHPSERRVLRHGRLTLDLDQYKAFWGESEVVLTVTELGVVRTLLERPGKVFSRDELMDGAYASSTVVADRTIDSHVRRVRAKFRAAGGDPVETVHGAGYKLGTC